MILAEADLLNKELKTHNIEIFFNYGIDNLDIRAINNDKNTIDEIMLQLGSYIGKETESHIFAKTLKWLGDKQIPAYFDIILYNLIADNYTVA